METVTAPGLAPEESQATYDTVLDGQPAIIKYFRFDSSRARSEILSSLGAAQTLNHPNLIRILQWGETDLAEERTALPQESHSDQALSPDNAASPPPSWSAGGRWAKEKEEKVGYAIMEKADDNLAAVLRHRPLDGDEIRELLDGVLPALEFLHAKGYVHSRIRPGNILACGNTVKVSSDRIRSMSIPRTVVEPPRLYDAPETGSGQFSPESDVYSVAILILEALTGAPLESGIPQLSSPFREIVEGGVKRDPKARWTLHRIRETLHPEAARSTPFASAPAYEERQSRPKYRKLGAVSIAGAVVAGSVCALLVRSAHQAPQAPATPAPMVRAPVMRATPRQARPLPKPPLENASETRAAHGRWVIVGAAYRKQADAEKRALSIRKAHPQLRADVYPAAPGARRYLVLLGEEESQADAKKTARKVRSEGAPRGVYVTRLE